MNILRRGREKNLNGKLCECGCGEETFLITDSQKSKGLKKGEPHRFIQYHSRRNCYSGKWYKGIGLPNGKTRDSHRVIAEKAIGKPLPKGCQVHHHNGEKDGGPLILCQDAAYHKLLHLRQKAYRATKDPHKRKCTFCKQWDLPENMKMLKNGHNFHHGECKTRHSLIRSSPMGILFNKVKDLELDEIPDTYLDWLQGQSWFVSKFQRQSEAIAKELATRRRSRCYIEDQYGKTLEDI